MVDSQPAESLCCATMAAIFSTSNNIFSKPYTHLSRHWGKTKTLNCHHGDLQTISSSKPCVLLSRNHAIWRLWINKLIQITEWPRTKQQFWYYSSSISLQTICLHEQKFVWMCQVKKRPRNLSFLLPWYIRWPCTKQPSWNFSNNFFQPTYSFELKLDRRHHAAWRLKIN